MTFYKFSNFDSKKRHNKTSKLSLLFKRLLNYQSFKTTSAHTIKIELPLVS